MAISVNYLSQILVNGVDLSDHAENVKIVSSQETKDITTHGQSNRLFRPGLSSIAVEATFFNDHAASNVENTLRPLVAITSTGFTITAKKSTATTSTSNPRYDMTAIIDGDVSHLDATIGEVGKVTVRFVPYSGGLTVTTTSS